MLGLGYGNTWLLIVLVLWALPWKGYALWTAARRGEKWWFIIILIVNTFSILEICYIFIVAKKKLADVKQDLKNLFRKKK